MKLVDILARELKVWPEGEWGSVGQSESGALHNGNIGRHDRWTPEKFTLATDWIKAIVTRAEWQAAVEALKAEKAAELKWPDGATHYVPPQEKNENGVFYLVFNDNAIYSWALLKSGVDNGGPVYGEINRHHLPDTIPRPTERAFEWDEYGFPSVGVSCEFTSNDGHNWKGCKILYADEVSILTGEFEGKPDRRLLRKCDADVKFRPIRTQEQIEAEERKKAINEMILLDEKGSLSRTHFCGLLYDASYRKQPQ